VLLPRGCRSFHALQLHLTRGGLCALHPPRYATSVDMWSAGCILAELVLRKPLFPGKTELEQLDLVFRVMGTPSAATWPSHAELPRFETLRPKETYTRTLEER